MIHIVSRQAEYVCTLRAIPGTNLVYLLERETNTIANIVLVFETFDVLRLYVHAVTLIF